METLIRLVAGALLIAHGLVHTLWFVPHQDDAWPFRLERPWLLPEPLRRPVGIAVVALTVLAFLLVGLAVWGVPGLAGAWPLLTVWAAASSLLMLVAFWDAQLVWGAVIDLALVVLAVWRPDWTNRLG